ncbi:MAG: hypothetical protein K9H26_18490 [Prolixibacteraceae bacterium]|nr:hypothetical protein [Prolixibacteraceae bacterium]
MKRIFFFFFSLFFISSLFAQELKIDFPYIKQVETDHEIPVEFVRYGICQLRFEMVETQDGLFTIKYPEKHLEKIGKLIATASNTGVNVLVFAELSLAFENDIREKTIQNLSKIAKENDMIIIAGSFYNANRQNTVPVIMPGKIEYSYKIKQSMFEVSPQMDKGMERGDTLLIISGKYGKILPIVCVDLISDEVQFVARYLSNRNMINTLINMNYNPAGAEFMREMSAIVKRHALYGMIVNVANPDKNFSPVCAEEEYGHTSLFAALNIGNEKLTENIMYCFKDSTGKKLHPAYSTLVAQIDPDKEGMMIFDLNLSTIRPPEIVNAPDQGYPTVRNMETIFLE